MTFTTISESVAFLAQIFFGKYVFGFQYNMVPF